MNFRTISKLCFLLVIIGFCMPLACDGNGFDIASSGYVDNSFSMLLYGIFISAIIGFLIGILLLLKKNIPIHIDWVILIVCLCCSLIPFFVCLKEYGNYYQSGVIFIIIGLTTSIIFQIISNINKNISIEKDKAHKICPYCANEIKKEAILCQFCGKEIQDNQVSINEQDHKKIYEEMSNDPKYKKYFDDKLYNNHLNFILKTKGANAFVKRLEELSRN
jgi:large-conductance mechanosensitive channel